MKRRAAMKSPEQWDKEGVCYASVAKMIQDDALADGFCSHHTDEERRNHSFACPICNTALDKRRINELTAQLAEKASKKKELRDKFSDMLVAEVKRHGGIPHLSKEEMAFREALAEYLIFQQDAQKHTGTADSTGHGQPL